MKINNKIFAGMMALSLLFGLLMVGCITFGPPPTYIETETSKAIFDTISEIASLKEVPAKGSYNGIEYSAAYELEQKISAGDLLSELGKKYSGLNLQIISGGSIYFTYQGKEYVILCSFESTGAVVSTVGRNSILEKIVFVIEKE